MGSPVIKIGIQATTSAAEVQIAQAYQKMAAASLELQNVQSRHTDILKNYQAGVLNAATATNFLSENIKEQTAVTEQLAAAKIELKTASLGEAAAENEVAGATQKTVSSYYAAQGAARVLEGGIPIRAFEKFISTISGVGPLLQAAFPVIGIVAMAELLIDAGEKLAKFGSEAGALDRELGIGWLGGAIAQMTSLGKEIKQADDELEKLATDRDRIREQKEGQDVESTRLQTQIDQYKKLTQGLGPENAANAQAYSRAARESAAAGERAADAEHAAQLQKRISALEAVKALNLQNAEILGQQASAEDAKDRVGEVGIARLRKEQEVAASQYKDALAEQTLLIQEKNNLELKGAVAGQREGRAGVSRTQENPADRLAAIEESQGGKNLVFEVQYWKEVVAQTGKYHEQLLRVEDEEEKLVQKMGEGSKIRERLAKDAEAQEAKPPAATDDLKDIFEYYEKAGPAYARYRDEIVKGNEILTENEGRLAAVRVELAEQSGAISKVSADHALGAIHAKEYADRIQDLADQMKALKAALPDAEAQGKGGEAAAQIQALQNQIYALQGQAATAGAQNQANTTRDLAAPYLHAFDTINQNWLQLQNKLIFGTRNITQAFANMGVSILESVAASFEKMLAAQLKLEIQSIIAHQVANRTKTASDIAAAGEADALNKTSALKENFILAKQAAAGAFSGVIQHVPPPLNAILAPVAAAAAFAGTLAVGAFEKGGLITAPTLALMGEAGTETVLPARLTTLLLNAANGGNTTNSSNSTNFTQSNTFHGFGDRQFKDMARRHSAAIADAVSREFRGGRRS